MNRVDHRNALSFCRSMICLAMLGFLPALDQARAEAPHQDNLAGQYRVTQWKSENGLPQNTVRCLLQAHDGYLWIGTQAGLARFDGLHFTVFNKANTLQMASDNIGTLAEGADGTLWIGTEDGLLRWQDHRLTAFTLGATHTGQRYIRHLSVARKGTLWVATYDGLYQVKQGQLTRYSTADGLLGNIIHTVFEESDGTVWVGTEIDRVSGGLQRRLAGSHEFVLMSGQGTKMSSIVHCFLHDRPDSFWWGNDAGLHRLAGGSVRDYHIQDGLSGERIWRLAPCRDGSLLMVIAERPGVTGRRGLQKFDPANGQCESILLPGPAADSDIICAIEDAEEGIWVGTRYNGLILLQPRLISSFTSRDGLSHNRVNAVYETQDGIIQIATTEGLCQIKDGQVIGKPAYMEQPDPIHAILQDGSGTIYAALRPWPGMVEGQLGVFHRGAGVWGGLNRQLLLENSPINCLALDQDDFLWIGQPDGVSRVPPPNGGRARAQKRPAPVNGNEGPVRFTKLDGLSSNDVRTVLSDHDGNVWLGTRGGGLNRWRDGKFAVFTKADGLCSDFVRTLFEDSDQAVWIGTDAGLNRLQGGRFSRITAKEGLVSDSINQILADDCGYFWLGCPRGLLRVSRAELNAVADGRTNVIHPILFGEAEGLPSSEISSFQPGACKSSDGRLWIPTSKGVAVIDPKNVVDPKTLHFNQVPPPVVIEQVKADAEIIYGDGVAALVRARADSAEATQAKESARALTSAATRLSHGRARVLEIHYTANSFVVPERIRFQYRLDDHDLDWVDAGSRRAAFYTNLRPGDYRFRVKACNNHGVWNEAAAPFAFYLAPHFYQTWSFYMLCAATVVLAGLGSHWLRVSILSKRLALEQQLALALERERIAKDMHDDLGSSLTQIGLLSERAKRDLSRPQEVASDVDKISETARQTARTMDEIVWAVNPRNDTLDNLANYLCQFAKEYLETTTIRCRFDVPEILPEVRVASEMRHSLLLVAKEALNNIVKHAAATEVWIGLKLESRSVVLSICDNGRGFALPGGTSSLLAQLPSESASSHSQPSVKGDGLLNMRKRIEDMGGRFQLSSEVGRGTKIIGVIQLDP